MLLKKTSIIKNSPGPRVCGQAVRPAGSEFADSETGFKNQTIPKFLLVRNGVRECAWSGIMEQ